MVIPESETLINESKIGSSDTISTITIMKTFSGGLCLTRYIDGVEMNTMPLSLNDMRALTECEMIGECF